MNIKNLLKKTIKNIFRNILISPTIMQMNEISLIKNNSKYEDSKSLVRYGQKIYSQNLEDGIITEVFNRIGFTNRIFVEFGAGTGLENNSAALLMQGWKGLWIDASKKNIAMIRKGLPNLISRKQLFVKEAFINKENINDLIGTVFSGEIDLLSVDIDGNDYAIYDSIKCINPRIIIFEYNAKFAPPIKYCLPYDQNFVWDGTDRFGVSLKYLEEKLDAKGYCLVGCDIMGINSFFVRKDLVKNKFLKPFTAEKHFEPARHHLIGFKSGFESSFRTINEAPFAAKQTL